jgi:hypothetical protein
VSCQVTELRHKGVKRKSNRTNRNPATAGMSVMNAELREAACERMGLVLDEHGLYLYMHVFVIIHMYMQLSVCIKYVYAFICLYLNSIRMYKHLSDSTTSF